jgi:hypothetical protein
MVSETSILQSQVPIEDMTIISTNLENFAIDHTSKMTKLKPRFAKFLCTHQEVETVI